MQHVAAVEAGIRNRSDACADLDGVEVVAFLKRAFLDDLDAVGNDDGFNVCAEEAAASESDDRIRDSHVGELSR